MLPHYHIGNKDRGMKEKQHSVIQKILITSYYKEEKITAGFVSVGKY